MNKDDDFTSFLKFFIIDNNGADEDVQPQEHKDELKQRNEVLEYELERLKDSCLRLISDFDNANNQLAKLKLENEVLKKEIEELKGLRKESYLDNGNLVKQNMAYVKAFGAILGAIEIAKGEIG